MAKKQNGLKVIVLPGAEEITKMLQRIDGTSSPFTQEIHPLIVRSLADKTVASGELWKAFEDVVTDYAEKRPRHLSYIRARIQAYIRILMDDPDMRDKEIEGYKLFLSSIQ